MKLFALLFSAVLLISCSNRKVEDVHVSFHTQTADGESTNAVFPLAYKGKVIHMRRIPDISFTDIDTHHPFQAADSSFGTILGLNQLGTNRLFTHTVANQGSLMVPVVNGVIGEPVTIDKSIGDGTLVIWGGLSEQEITHLDYSVRRRDDDEETATARAKAAKKTLKKFISENKKNKDDE